MKQMAIHDRTQRLTTAEFLAYCDLPENADRILEFIDGEIVEKMPSFAPSEIEATIIFYLKRYTMEHRSGHITTADGGYLMPNGNVFIPDVAYISKERLPERPPREAPVPPDLAFEVKSPTDYKRKMRSKADKYIEAGTRLDWLVFPNEQIVEV